MPVCSKCGHLTGESARFCEACGHALFSAAPSQPSPAQPGAKPSGPSGCGLAASIVGGILLLLWGAFLFNSMDCASLLSTSQESGSESGSQDRGAKRDPTRGCEITSWNWVKDPTHGYDGAVIWNAEVRNASSEYVRSVTVEFTTYDASGNVVDSDFATAIELAPGASRTVKSILDYHGNESSARVQLNRL